MIEKTFTICKSLFFVNATKFDKKFAGTCYNFCWNILFNEKWVYSVKDFGVIQIHFCFTFKDFIREELQK